MLLTLFALAQPAAGPAPAKDPELVVVAERLNSGTLIRGRNWTAGLHPLSETA